MKKWAIQRNWQHRVHKKKKQKQKQKKAQKNDCWTNPNNVSKT